MIELNVNWLPFGAGAITLVPFILYLPHCRTKAIEAHEHYHYKQALSWGVLPWYTAYIIIWLFYRNRPPSEHPLEREAYKIQWNYPQ